MKKLFLLLISCVVVFGFVSCDEETPSVQPDNADTQTVGKIENSYNNVFVPDDTYVLYKEIYTKTGVVVLYEYNDRGHCTRTVKNLADGGVREIIYDYTYNDDGSWSVHQTGDYSESIKEYDAEGRLVKETKEPDSNNMMRVETYVYADNGIVYFESRDKGGYIQAKETRHYNSDGLLELVDHYLSNDKLYAHTKYLYDENGNQTTSYALTPEGEKNSNNAVYEWLQEYDEYGRIVNIEKRDTAIGGLHHKETYEYFDEECYYKTTSITGLWEREYRPLSICIK